MKLEGIAQKITREMREKGKVVDLSKKASFAIDNIGYDNGFDKIKQEFDQKERASRAYAHAVETGMIHFYKKETMYEKLCSYLSNFKKWF